jgi:hypothetical protein
LEAAIRLHRRSVMEKKLSTPAANPAPVTLQVRELETVIAPQGIITTGPVYGIRLNHNETLVVDHGAASGKPPKRDTLATRELEAVIAPQGIIKTRR